MAVCSHCALKRLGRLRYSFIVLGEKFLASGNVKGDKWRVVHNYWIISNDPINTKMVQMKFSVFTGVNEYEYYFIKMRKVD